MWRQWRRRLVNMYQYTLSQDGPTDGSCAGSYSAYVAGNACGASGQNGRIVLLLISAPSSRPSTQPSTSPTSQPLCVPSTQPSAGPSAQPSGKPSRQPSHQPIGQPSVQPSAVPSTQPIVMPSSSPSTKPSTRPTLQPIVNPTVHPSCQPSSSPTTSPSASPSALLHCPGGTSLRKLPGRQVCDPCPAGTAAAPGDNVCTECLAGYYAPTSNSSYCLACPLNFYQPQPRETFCISCSAGYVTGTTASISDSACVNPTSSVVVGFFFSLISFIVMWAYVYRGRLQRIAFTRKERLVKKLIIIAGAASRALDLVNEVSKSMRNLIKEAQLNVWLPKKLSENVKIFFFFVLIGLMAFVVIIFSVLMGVSQVLFNIMILYRGYHIYLSTLTSLEDLLEEVIIYVGNMLHLSFLSFLFYPFVYVLNGISKINLNLNAVQVSCAGAQSPGLLLINMIIVGVVIIIIRSDIQVYWEVAQQRVLNKVLNLPFQYYFAKRNIASTCYHMTMAIALFFVPNPCKLIQYSMSLVTTTAFFAQGGRSVSNQNCDAAFSFPFDSFLAIVTTVIVYLALGPIVYMLSQVIVPSFKLGEKNYPMFQAFQLCFRSILSSISEARQMGDNNNDKSEEEINEDVKVFELFTKNKLFRSSLMGNIRASDPSRSIQSVDSLQNSGALRKSTSSSIQASDEFTVVNPAFNEYRRRREAATSPSRESSREAGSSVNSVDQSVSSENVHETTAKEEKLKLFRQLLSRFTRFVSTCFSVDWLYLKFVSTLIISALEAFRRFLLVDHVKALSTHLDMDNYKDEYEKLQTVRLEVSAMVIPEIPWLLAFYDTMLSKEDKMAEKEAERKLWQNEKSRFPNFVIASMNVRSEMCTHINRWIPIKYWLLHRTMVAFTYPASYLICFQLLTDVGRAMWRRVAENYSSVVTLSFGCWLEYMLDEFCILANFETFQHLLTFVEAKSTEEAYRLSSSVRLSMLEEGDIFIRSLNRKSKKQKSIDAGNDENVVDEDKNGDGEGTERELRISNTTMDTSNSDKRRQFFEKHMDAFVTLANDPKQIFLHYIAAIVKVRVVLLQIVPAFTLWSILAVELADCPVLVFSETAEKLLPPLQVTDPIAMARELLLQDARREGLENVDDWKVFTFAFYIYVRYSRLVHFVMILINSIGSFLIVFANNDKPVVYGVLFLIVIEFIILGIATFCYVTLLLHRFFFQGKSSTEEESAPPPPDEAAPSKKIMPRGDTN